MPKSIEPLPPDSKDKSCCCSKPVSKPTGNRDHWSTAYEGKAITGLGWYEEDPEPSMRLIRKCNLEKNASILNVGAGATTLVDALLDAGYEGVIASDLTASGLERLKERLGEKSSRVDWIVDDLTHPEKLNELAKVDVWHDRAVLHFFQEKKEQQAYFDLLRRLLRKGGYVIIAAFNLQGSEKCFGLPVHRYDEAMLQERLGPEFELKETFNFTYTTPSGDSREYVYTLFQRIV